MFRILSTAKVSRRAPERDVFDRWAVSKVLKLSFCSVCLGCERQCEGRFLEKLSILILLGWWDSTGGCTYTHTILTKAQTALLISLPLRSLLAELATPLTLMVNRFSINIMSNDLESWATRNLPAASRSILSHWRVAVVPPIRDNMVLFPDLTMSFTNSGPFFSKRPSLHWFQLCLCFLVHSLVCEFVGLQAHSLSAIMPASNITLASSPLPSKLIRFYAFRTFVGAIDSGIQHHAFPVPGLIELKFIV